jgi:hypothetical protein
VTSVVVAVFEVVAVFLRVVVVFFALWFEEPPAATAAIMMTTTRSSPMPDTALWLRSHWGVFAPPVGCGGGAPGEDSLGGGSLDELAGTGWICVGGGGGGGARCGG